jgi:hypothetical protein
LGDMHLTVPKLTVQVDWHPRPPIWQRFGSDPALDPKWRSGTVANTYWNGHSSIPTSIPPSELSLW